MNDNTLNMLTKYVYKILGVYNLNCNYDINEEKNVDVVIEKF